MKRNMQKEVHWRVIVKRQARSGLSVCRFCAERDISEASFYAWRKKLARRDREKVAASSGLSEKGAADCANDRAFIPLAVAEPQLAMEVVHPLGYRVRITGEVDAESLKRVLDALDQRGER